jgi:hypothetical protein
MSRIRRNLQRIQGKISASSVTEAFSDRLNVSGKDMASRIATLIRTNGSTTRTPARGISRRLVHLPFIAFQVESCTMDYMKMKKAVITAGIVSVLAVAAPAFAQSYYGNNGYTSSYYPQQSYSYGTPMIYQPVTMPSYINYAPVNIPNYGQVNSYSINNPMQQQYQYQMPQQYVSNQYPSSMQPYFYYTFPPVNQVQYHPSSYQNPVQYGPTYSYPEYDPYYAANSNYYTMYPQQNLGFTGDRDALGTPLCNWQGYGRSDCDFNPHQWVYDPYTGTWY